MDDAELIFRISRGDEEAFKKFYEKFAPRVFRYALTLVRDRHLAEEVVQETMVTAWKSAKKFQGRSQVSTWVFGIARNHARSLLRRTPEIVEEPEELEVQGAGPVEQGERVRKALEKLPALEREVVVLAFYQGLSYREIAEILGIPEGTVKSRMFHARKHLRELLGLGSPWPGERGVMRKCAEIAEILPWYPGDLSPAEAAEVALHLFRCPQCRAEFSQIQALRKAVSKALDDLPGPSPEVWGKVLLRTKGLPLGRLEMGSEFLGLSLGFSLRGKSVPFLWSSPFLGRGCQFLKSQEV